ncbi:hypothetical protein V8C43DRAFT_319751 [Trichoderma afarasin]
MRPGRQNIKVPLPCTRTSTAGRSYCAFGGKQTVTSRVHDRGTSTDLLGCIYAYPHTHLHARTAHTNNHTCILHARTELYPPRANANKAALVPYSCNGRDTSIENLPYPGLAECLPATPMAIGKQMANDNKEREKKTTTRQGSAALLAPAHSVCSSRLPSNLMATAEQHIHTCPPTYTYIMYVRTHMHPDHLLVPTCAIRHQKRSPS